jgi:2-polyprenyl-3-methyl-5-hydroxy-6-metoxy-1,4-benzoquinol methylase
MNDPLLPFFNPVALVRAWLFHCRTNKYYKPSDDLELVLYSRILKNDMLHFGYFENGDLPVEFISLGQLEEAQKRYAEIVLACIRNKDSFVLDVGCGMGGLSYKLHNSGFKVEALTPNKSQFLYLKKRDETLPCYHCKFESFSTQKKFGTILNAESLQYIPLEEAFHKADEIIEPHGQWIISDCFRLNQGTTSRSGHQLSAFSEKLKEHGWSITYERDITLNVIPTLKLVSVYINRFLLPLADYAEEKLRYKKAWLYYLTEKSRQSLTGKMKMQISAVNPETFCAERKYMLFVLQKS